MKYEKTQSYGDTGSFSFRYLGNFGDNLEYAEVAVIKLFCDFDFTNYPFDYHQCDLTYGDDINDADYIRLKSATVKFYEKGCRKILTISIFPSS